MTKQVSTAGPLLGFLTEDTTTACILQLIRHSCGVMHTLSFCLHICPRLWYSSVLIIRPWWGHPTCPDDSTPLLHLKDTAHLQSLFVVVVAAAVMYVCVYVCYCFGFGLLWKVKYSPVLGIRKWTLGGVLNLDCNSVHNRLLISWL